MTLTEGLNLATQVILVFVALITLVEFLKHRDRVRLEINLMLGSLATISVIQLAGLAAPWLGTVAIISLLAHPYLLVRLVEHFARVSRALHMGALVAMLLSWVVVVAEPALLRTPAVLPIIAYFVSIEGYAAFAFINGAARGGGITRRRLLLGGVASALLASVILLAAARMVVPLPVDLIRGATPVLAVAMVLCYYAAFALPAPLRRYWQLTELHLFLRKATALSNEKDSSKQVIDLLCTSAARVVGARATLAFLEDDKEGTLHVRGEKGVAEHAAGVNDIVLQPNSDDFLNSTLRSEHPIPAPATRMPEALAQLAEHIDATSLFLVPISTKERNWGLLIVFMWRPSLFPDDDIGLLDLLAEQSATVLENAELLAQQRSLVTQLQSSVRELEAFSYSVSHDLRAPLRSIDGFSQAVLEDYGEAVGAQGRDYLERVRRAAQHMAQLIDDMLNLSRVSRSELRFEECDLSAIARSIATDLKGDAPEREAEFVVPENLSAKGDPRLLRIALENLISNAWKFTGHHATASIEFGELPRENGSRAFFVRDDGAGFDMKYQSKLFGAFQRLHAQEDFPGSGIGLAIVQRVINRHGGRVWAEGEIERGATFYFELPAKGGIEWLAR